MDQSNVRITEIIKIKDEKQLAQYEIHQFGNLFSNRRNWNNELN